MKNMAVCTLLFIGTVNLLNFTVTSVNARKKEFAMMQSIRVTKKQMRILLILEGINIAAIILFISYVISFAAICTLVKMYLSTQWTASYHFTITPLLWATPILILITTTVPLLCFQQMQKVEIIDRLQGDAGCSY